MTRFKASAYRITVQENEIEGTTYYVGTVAELPDVAVYEDDFQAAYSAISQVIEDLQIAAEEEGRTFPSPRRIIESDVSGRITLRLPKTLHATLERQAKAEETSLNQHLVYLLADGSARVEQRMSRSTTASQTVRAAAPITAKVAEISAFVLSTNELVRRTLVESQHPGYILRRTGAVDHSDNDVFGSLDYDPVPYVGNTYANH